MMFSTTMATLAVSGLMANANLVTPNWVTDYSRAVALATEQAKPMAVFITAGAVKDDGIGADTAKLLKDRFVVLHVDTTTADGKATAKTFEMGEGLVISDRAGKLQALRHGGAVSADQLQGYLTKFSSATATAATTEYQGTGAPAAAATVVPASYYVPYTGMRSSCPNCR